MPTPATTTSAPHSWEQPDLFPDPGQILRERRRPIPASEFAGIIGCSRFTIYRAIHGGEFGDGNVLRNGRNFYIFPAAAYTYYESLIYEPTA